MSSDSPLERTDPTPPNLTSYAIPSAPRHQIMFLSAVGLFPVVTTWLIPGTAVYDETSNNCSTNTASMYPTLAMSALGLYAILYLW